MTHRISLSAALIVLAISFVAFAPKLHGQTTPGKIPATGQIKFNPAVERSMEDMDAFAAVNAAPTPRAVPFRPTMSDAEYQMLKQSSAASSNGRINQGEELPEHAASTVKSFAGPSECDGTGGCWHPPDSEGAMGQSDFVSVDNTLFSVYTKTGHQVKLISLNSFCGYATETFFDPRVVYDATWNRWVVTTQAFAEPSGSAYYCIAVSETSSATGKWWFYFLNTGTIFGGLYDFPEVGLSQDAVIFTANIFNPNYSGASTYAVAKAILYNGLGFSVPLHSGLIGTLSAPHELDQNECTWLAAASSGGITMYAFCDPGNAFYSSLKGPYTVTGVSAYSVPPSAPQPSPCTASTDKLDTSDTRFVNAGTQNGDLYYQVHSILNGTATGKYYIISGLNSFAPAVSVQNQFWTTTTSSDFNASIVADGSGNVVIGWSSVDAGGSPNNPEVRYVSWQSADTPPSGAGGTTLFTSPACLTGDGQGSTQRWGDYSAVTVDPNYKGLDPNAFWLINESVLSPGGWSTEIGHIKF